MDKPHKGKWTHWRVQVGITRGSGPLFVQFFTFHAVSGQLAKVIGLNLHLSSWHPLLENPRSATRIQQRGNFDYLLPTQWLIKYCPVSQTGGEPRGGSAKLLLGKILLKTA